MNITAQLPNESKVLQVLKSPQFQSLLLSGLLTLLACQMRPHTIMFRLTIGKRNTGLCKGSTDPCFLIHTTEAVRASGFNPTRSQKPALWWYAYEFSHQGEEGREVTS